jgi:hypothetical protein
MFGGDAIDEARDEARRALILPNANSNWYHFEAWVGLTAQPRERRTEALRALSERKTT